jgi:hypothetical protein
MPDSTYQTREEFMASRSERTQDPPLLPAIGLIILGFLGYGAFLVSGLYRNSAQSPELLPIYAYLVLLLAVLQVRIAQKPSPLHQVFLLATSAIAAAYAYIIFVGGVSAGFTRRPLTYVILELVLLGVFAYDATIRFLQSRQAPGSEQPEHPEVNARVATDGDSAEVERRLDASHRAFVVAANTLGLAILFFIFYGLLSALGSPQLFQRLGFKYNCPTPRPWSCPYLPPIILPFKISLGSVGSIHTLDGLDLALGGLAIAVALFLMAIARLLEPPDPSNSVWKFVKTAANEVFLSLRLVVDPLLWLFVALLLANISQILASYLQPKPPVAYDGKHILQLLSNLFWPISPESGADFASLFSVIAFGALAAVAVVAAVMVVEHDRSTVERTVQLLARFGRRVAGSLAFFIYSLGAVNFFICVAGYPYVPFRVGAAGLVAIVAYVVILALPHMKRSPIASGSN